MFADLINGSSSFKTLPDSTVRDYLDIIDFISGSPQDVLEQAQMKSNATKKIIESLENIGSQVQLQDGHSRFVSNSTALEVWDLTYGGNVSQTTGLKIAKSSSKDLRHDNVFTVKSGNVDFGLVEDAIFLQEEIVTSLTTQSKRPQIRLVMKALTNTRIFEVSSQQNRSSQTPSPEGSKSQQTSSPEKVRSVINSRVLSMQMLVDDQRLTNLTPHYVTLVFSPLNETWEQTSANISCVYWNLLANQGTGGWARDGCGYNRTESGKVICTCNHLTNFAIFLDYYDQDPEMDEHAGVLSIISIVGLSLSIFGLSLSIVSFLLVKSLRDSLPQKLMFQLSLALLFSWIVFLVGIEQTSSHDECLAIAVLLHYLILSSFMWMLGHGILQHMLIVQVQKAVSPKFLIAYTIIAWGFPIIPVVAVLSVDPELYNGGDSYCWMKPTALYYSFALPVGLIVITNIIIFIQIVIRLHKRGGNVARVTQQGTQTLVNVRASVISFCILGLSWTFGFFAIGGARVYFQYLFCTLVSVQGFLIFAMMVARNHNVQQYWRSVFCYARSRSRSTTDSEKFMTKGHHLKSGSNNSAVTYKTNLRCDSQDESSH